MFNETNFNEYMNPCVHESINFIEITIASGKI